MATRISAVLDESVIKSDYIRSGVTDPLITLKAILTHQYRDSTDSLKEITIGEIAIPTTALSTRTLSTGEVEERAVLHFANPTYIDDLFITMEEVRTSGTLLTKVQVLSGDNSNVGMPDNPIKEFEHEENKPPQLHDENEDNVVVSEPSLQPVFYDLATGVITVQSGARIVLVQGSDPSQFVQQDQNTTVSPIFIENAITNQAANPDLSGSGKIPDLWNVPPSSNLMYTSSLGEDPGLIPGTKYWAIRVQNPNLFSPFNSLSLVSDRVPLYSGMTCLTGSAYYRLLTNGTEIPFEKINITFHFYDSADNLISSVSKPFTNLTNQVFWNLLWGTLKGSEIPLTATQHELEFEIAEVNDSDPILLHLYLPQVEGTLFPTTRTLGTRVQDSYRVGNIDLEIPAYFRLTTTHVTAPGVRGLFDTTTSLKNGFQFLASGNRLLLKVYNAVGLESTTISDVFAVADGEEVTYGFHSDGALTTFYVDGIAVSSAAQALTLQSTGLQVGSLVGANTAINSELIDFVITRDQPS